MWLKAYCIFSSELIKSQGKHLRLLRPLYVCVHCMQMGWKDSTRYRYTRRYRYRQRRTTRRSSPAQKETIRPPVAMSVYVNCKPDDSHNSAHRAAKANRQIPISSQTSPAGLSLARSGLKKKPQPKSEAPPDELSELRAVGPKVLSGF